MVTGVNETPGQARRRSPAAISVVVVSVVLLAIGVVVVAREINAMLIVRKLTRSGGDNRQKPLRSLGGIADGAVIRHLIGRLSGDEQERQAAIHALEQIGAPAKPQLLRALGNLRSRRGCLRATGSALALGTMGAMESVPLIVSACGTCARKWPDGVFDGDFPNDMNDALASLGPAAVHEIVQSVTRDKTAFGGMVEDALLQIGTMGGVEQLVRESEDPTVTYFMYDIWLAIGDPRVVPAFVRGMQSARGDEEYYFAWALSILGGAEADRHIQEYKRTHSAEIGSYMIRSGELLGNRLGDKTYVLLFLSREYGKPTAEEIAHSGHGAALTIYEEKRAMLAGPRGE